MQEFLFKEKSLQIKIQNGQSVLHFTEADIKRLSVITPIFL